jgi:hypothetical protein
MALCEALCVCVYTSALDVSCLHLLYDVFLVCRFLLSECVVLFFVSGLRIKPQAMKEVNVCDVIRTSSKSLSLRSFFPFLFALWFFVIVCVCVCVCVGLHTEKPKHSLSISCREMSLTYTEKEKNPSPHIYR